MLLVCSVIILLVVMKVAMMVIIVEAKSREYGVCFAICFLIFELSSNAKSIAL